MTYHYITSKKSKLTVPDRVIIPVISGDGIGPEIWDAAKDVLEKAISHCYASARHILWEPVLAGKAAFDITSSWLPDETLDIISKAHIALKGPLMTPVGTGITSINVALRRHFDLYSCVRPIRWYQGVPSPVIHPERVNMVIFRENTEDIYTGIEWPNKDPHNTQLISFLQESLSVKTIRFPKTSGIGVKVISKEGTERFILHVMQYALRHGHKTITLVHKGNIMKHTEGAFREWSYAYLCQHFSGQIFTWLEYEQLSKDQGELQAKKALEVAKQSGKVIINDCIADAFFQNALITPEQYEVVATTNLNGDYISDALAAQVGGIGISPGANINDKTKHAIFEATHGTAPSIAGLNKANPSAMILSGAMLLDYIGWSEAAHTVQKSLQCAIENKVVTEDFNMPSATIVSTDKFSHYMCKQIK